MGDWRKMGAAELGRGIAAGAIDPVELAECFLDAVGEDRDIYARLTPVRARAEATAARTRAANGTRHGPLDGVPLSWKDLFDSAGVATEAGSALLEGRVPEDDAVVLAEATRAGLVCLGKTHMSELAFSGLGLNPVTATPPNRHDPALLPGGSSSGAAASIAFGLAPAAIGSDTGGSVRVPAAWNDLVGLKTTSGRLSIVGAVPLCASFDTVGPLAQNVEDAALLLAALENGRPADLSGASLSGARFLVLDPYASDVRDAPGAAFQAALAKLSGAGAKIETGSIPAVDEAMSLSGDLYPTEAYGTWMEVIEAAPHKMFARILDRFRGGADVSAPDFVAAWLTLRRCRDIYAARTAGFDAVLLPTAPNLPPDRERLLTDDAYYVTENLLTLRNTRVGNLMGGAALTLPTGVPSCGIMLIGTPMGEERLLRLGAAAEAALA
ncbi:amidase [Rhodobacterales bacterium HKCCE2091]|nr:amidase [Rhodobacterales bacterium HKCCE2091]